MYRAWTAASPTEPKAPPQIRDLKQQFGNNLEVIPTKYTVPLSHPFPIGPALFG